MNNYLAISKRRKNCEIIANRLPPEVLSRIMLIGVESDRRVWCWGSQSLESQEIASHVCSYWRGVAINTPRLWTFIHLARGIPAHRSVLYLCRAGSIAPLDITIDLRTIDPAHKHNSDINVFLSDIHAALTSQGVQGTRWQSLLVHTSWPTGDNLSGLINSLGELQIAGPSLQRLRLDCGPEMSGGRLGHYPTIPYSEGVISESGHAFLTSLSSSPLCLEVRAPRGCVLEPIRAFAKLKELTIISTKVKSNQLGRLLTSYTQIESLYLDDNTSNLDMLRKPWDYPLPMLIFRCKMAPSLRSLSIRTGDDALWVCEMIQTIGATGLRSFTLMCNSNHSRGIWRIVKQITRGGRGPGNPSLGPYPIFPLLQSLNISRFVCSRDLFIELVSAFPELNHITLAGQQLQWLNEVPLMHPHIESLGVFGVPVYAEEVKNFLSRQEAAGHPIEEVEVRGTHQGRLRRSSAQQRSPNSIPGSPFVIPGYTYSEYEDDEEIGDLRSLQRQPTNNWQATSCSSMAEITGTR